MAHVTPDGSPSHDRYGNPYNNHRCEACGGSGDGGTCRLHENKEIVKILLSSSGYIYNAQLDMYPGGDTEIGMGISCNDCGQLWYAMSVNDCRSLEETALEVAMDALREGTVARVTEAKIILQSSSFWHREDKG